MHHGSEITAVIQNHIHIPGLTVLEDGLFDAPLALGFGLALPGIDRNTCGGNTGSGMVLGGENITGRPAYIGTEFHQGFDQHGGLHGHMDTAKNPRIGQGFGCGISGAQTHQRRHFGFCQGDFPATEVGQ